MDEIKQIGKFKVVGKLGQGSFGLVLKGYDPDIRREVAIKICTVADIGLRKRFAREAQISGNLQHKNIVTVFAADTNDDGVPYLVQEFLDGEDLRDLIRRRKAVPSNRKIDYLLQVARGLAHAHAHGVIHRDIKPANVRRLSDGTVKIMDFGIAKLASAETQLTQKGVTMGTASYLPPEQVRGGDLDHRADIFSFGVLAYELLTYERPFQGNTLSALVYQILYKVPAPMSGIWPECPDALSDLVAKCLEKEPADRFATMEEIFPRLERIAEEIEAGKWPALRGVSTVQAFLSDVADDTGVMSQTEISRTAQALEGAASPSRTVSAAPPPGRAAAAAPGPGAGRPTAEALSLETAPTQILVVPETPEPPRPEPPRPEPPKPEPPKPEPPKPEPPPFPATGTAEHPATTLPLSREDLAQRAHQIGKLIEEGKLEDAKESLERTMSRQLEGSGTGQSRVPQPPPATPVTVAVPAAPIPAAPKPAAPRPAGRGTREGAAPESDTGTGGDYKTALSSLTAGWRRWAALAAVVLLAVAGVWWRLGRGDPASEVEARPGPEQRQSAGQEPASALPAAPQGWVTVAARPWAEITEITDANGYLKTIPPDPYTPLRFELPTGSYQIQLEYHPDGFEAELSSCEVAVVEGESAVCQVEFTSPTVTEYFKDSGWWQ